MEDDAFMSEMETEGADRLFEEGCPTCKGKGYIDIFCAPTCPDCNGRGSRPLAKE